MVASTGVPRAATENWSNNIPVPVRLSTEIVGDLVESVEITCKKNVGKDRDVSSRLPSELHRKAKENVAEKVKIQCKEQYEKENAHDHVGSNRNSNHSNQISVEALIRRFREAQPLPREERLKAKSHGKQKLWSTTESREKPNLDPVLHDRNGRGVNTSGEVDGLVNLSSKGKSLDLFFDDHLGKQDSIKVSELTNNAANSSQFCSSKAPFRQTRSCESAKIVGNHNEIVAECNETGEKAHSDSLLHGSNGHIVITSGEVESLANISSKGKYLDLFFYDHLGKQLFRNVSELTYSAASSSQFYSIKSPSRPTRSCGSTEIDSDHNDLVAECNEIPTVHYSGSANNMTREVFENDDKNSIKAVDDMTEVKTYSVYSIKNMRKDVDAVCKEEVARPDSDSCINLANQRLYKNDMNSMNEVVDSDKGNTSAMSPEVSEQGKGKTIATQIEEEYGLHQDQSLPIPNTSIQASQTFPWKHGQRIRVRILWDIENLQVPKGRSAFSLATIFYGIARQEASKLFEVVSPQAVSVRLLCFHNPDRRTISKRIRKELVAACCTLIDIGKGKVGQADNIICDEIGCIMEDFDPTYTMVMLITGDMDFVSDVRRLSEAKFKTFCVYPQHASDSSLRHQCFDQFSWKTLDWNILSQSAQRIISTPPASPMQQRKYQDSSNMVVTALSKEEWTYDVMKQANRDILRGSKNMKEHNNSKQISQSIQKETKTRNKFRKKRGNSKTKNVGIQCSPGKQKQSLPHLEVVQVASKDKQISTDLDFVARMDPINFLAEENEALKRCQFLKTRIEAELSLLNERLQDTKKHTTSGISKSFCNQ